MASRDVRISWQHTDIQAGRPNWPTRVKPWRLIMHSLIRHDAVVNGVMRHLD
jgi:hypothetical protein